MQETEHKKHKIKMMGMKIANMPLFLVESAASIPIYINKIHYICRIILPLMLMLMLLMRIPELPNYSAVVMLREILEHSLTTESEKIRK